MWYLLLDPITPKFNQYSSTLMDIATKAFYKTHSQFHYPGKPYIGPNGEKININLIPPTFLPTFHLIMFWIEPHAQLGWRFLLTIVLVSEEHCLPRCSFPKVLVQYIFFLVSLVHALLVQSMPSSHLGCAAKSRFLIPIHKKVGTWS